MNLKKKRSDLEILISLFLERKKNINDLQRFSWEMIDYFSDTNSENLPFHLEIENAFWYTIWQMQHLADEEHEKDGTLYRELTICLGYLQNKIPMPEPTYELRPKMEENLKECKIKMEPKNKINEALQRNSQNDVQVER